MSNQTTTYWCGEGTRSLLGRQIGLKGVEKRGRERERKGETDKDSVE